MKLPPPVIKLPPANALARAQTHYCSWATNSWRTRVQSSSSVSTSKRASFLTYHFYVRDGQIQSAFNPRRVIPLLLPLLPAAKPRGKQEAYTMSSSDIRLPSERTANEPLAAQLKLNRYNETSIGRSVEFQVLEDDQKTRKRRGVGGREGRDRWERPAPRVRKF